MRVLTDRSRYKNNQKKTKKRYCACGRPALYSPAGKKHKSNGDHPLCRQCYQSVRDQTRKKIPRHMRGLK